MIQTIHLIGALKGETIFQDSEIRQLLAVQTAELAHGKSFTGRINTQIHVNEQHIIKVRNELRLDEKSAIRWVKQALVKEQNYQVHHPHKTWFVAIDDTQNNALIGNICPRIQPLHTLIGSPSPESLDPTQYLNYLQQALNLYFRLASQFKIRLDEGLSNFGLTPTGEIYYLDDDCYQWDRFISCAHMLGVYIRSLSWLRGESASTFGGIVHKLIIDHFNDSQYLTVLAEQLRDVFMPGVAQQAALLEFTNALKHKPVTTQNSKIAKKNVTKSRYFAILADVHANLPALETVLTFLAEENIQQGIVLGDVVGYGPHPAACIERLQDSEFIILKGNHDHGLATNNFIKGFSSTAAWVLNWYQERVSTEDKQWLLDLPPVWYEETWMAVHGAPIDPTFFNAYVYEMTYHDNLDVLARKHIRYCFHGHTHQPGIYARRHHKDSLHKAEHFDLTRFEHALVCPGAVGQPRNKQPGAQFAIYDREQQQLSYHCLPYDVERLIQEMEAEGFPNTLSRLLRGKM